MTKDLAGRALTEGEFSFELKNVTDPENPVVVQTGVTNAADGSVTFDAIEYTQDDIGKTYKYTIVEVAGAEGGMTYDPMEVEVTVTVTDAGNGELTVTPTYPEDTEFNNKYEAGDSWTPEVTKVLLGSTLTEGEFSFELKNVTDPENPVVVQTGVTNAADGSVTFDPISYTQDDIGKTYTYTIVEVAGSEIGMSYDKMIVTVTVTVADAGNGKLAVTPEYPEDTEFNNTYTSPKTSVQVTKVWDDEDDKDGSRPKSITVQLLADGVDTGKTLVLTADNKWMGTFTDLDEYKNKKKIVYSVNEKAVEGYTALIVEKDGQYVITNSHKPVPPPPKTGESLGSYSWMGMMLIAYGALLLIRRRRRAMD